MATDYAAAVYLEKGLRAMREGDGPGAIGAFACIADNDWAMFAERFPGIHAQIPGVAGAPIELPGTHAAIEPASGTAAEPDDDVLICW